jgi:hypothetical protein
MPNNQPNESCTTGCGFIATERNRYFTGKYMTARDFHGEQAYFLSRHQLHNRLFHGWGVVCGLEVIPHKDPECDDNWVIVCPGIAIDCCGRELVVERKTPKKVWDPPPDEPEEPQDTTSEATGYEQSPSRSSEEEPPPRPGPFLLYLRYVEEKIEYVPALYTEGACDPQRQEANRVREVARLEARPWEEIKTGGWRLPEGDPESRCRDDCADPWPGPAGVCLMPDCPTDAIVPLALIHPIVTEGGYYIGEDEIETLGRRQLPLPGEFLTHIVGVNWPHGGDVSLSQLRNPAEEGGMDLQLRVRFDRKLLPADGYATGINEFTFVVEYGGMQQDLEFLPPDGPPGLDEEDDCVAVFNLAPRYVRGLVENRVLVTLKCDFILDCHGNPVDGDFLRGRLPSGNTLQGGTFESWFRVVHDSGEYGEEE